MAIAERIIQDNLQPQEPEAIRFEGIDIQWNKSSWIFEDPEKGTATLDTYSIWNSAYHGEIVQRLASGEKCALYLMGNFGVAQLRGSRVKNKQDAMFDSIKKRDRSQSLAAFVHPFDTGQMIDFERLPEEFSSFKDPEKRLSIYSGPMHAILPIRKDYLPDLGEIRPEETASFFWIPEHTGYEGLYNTARKIFNGGILGGGSLNEHGKDPSTTSLELKQAISQNADWQNELDFVIFDEIAEASRIGRSHTQVSFMQDPPKIVRLGSVSPLKIFRETGRRVVVDGQSVKHASSKTPYDNVHDFDSDRNVEIALARMARFQLSLERSGRLSGPAI